MTNGRAAGLAPNPNHFTGGRAKEQSEFKPELDGCVAKNRRVMSVWISRLDLGLSPVKSIGGLSGTHEPIRLIPNRFTGVQAKEQSEARAATACSGLALGLAPVRRIGG